VHDAALARLHAAMLLTLKGTPVLYNGEEIGMTDLLLERFEQLRDNQAVNLYHLAVGDGIDPAEAMKMAAAISRDRCRTPFQWANAPNAGFSPPGVATWLPVNPNYAQGVNVADQEQNPNSLLNYYRRLIAVRARRRQHCWRATIRRSILTRIAIWRSCARRRISAAWLCTQFLARTGHNRLRSERRPFAHALCEPPPPDPRRTSGAPDPGAV
jgi:glycosidase